MQILVISGVSCSGLSDEDWGPGKSDPYCTFLVGEAGTSWMKKLSVASAWPGRRLADTSPIKDNLNPSWPAWSVELSTEGIENPELHVRVFDTDDALSGGGADDKLAECRVAIDKGAMSQLVADHEFETPGKDTTGKGTISVSLSRSAPGDKKRTISSVQRARLGIISASAVHLLPESGSKLGKGGAAAGAEGAFSLALCKQCVKLAAVAYFDECVWASKKENAVQEQYEAKHRGGIFGLGLVGIAKKQLASAEGISRPEQLSPNVRYLLGDLSRLKLINGNHQGGLLTLDSEFNFGTPDSPGVSITNGILCDQEKDHQGFILLGEDKKSVYVVFRGTDAAKSVRAGLKDFWVTLQVRKEKRKERREKREEREERKRRTSVWRSRSPSDDKSRFKKFLKLFCSALFYFLSPAIVRLISFLTLPFSPLLSLFLLFSPLLFSSLLFHRARPALPSETPPFPATHLA